MGQGLCYVISTHLPFPCILPATLQVRQEFIVHHPLGCREKTQAQEGGGRGSGPRWEVAAPACEPR